jgi:hypothetical protein
MSLTMTKVFLRTATVFCGTCLAAMALHLAWLWIPPWGAVVTFHRKMHFEHLRWVSVFRSMELRYSFRPAPFCAPEHYTDRWTAWLMVPESGTYSLVAHSDDGVRVYLDGHPMVDNWQDQGFGMYDNKTNVWLSAGRHALTVTHYNNTGPGALALEWSGGSISTPTVIGGRFLRKRLPDQGEGIE